MLNPVAMTIIATTFPVPTRRAKAIGVFGATAGLALTTAGCRRRGFGLSIGVQVRAGVVLNWRRHRPNRRG